MAEQQISLKKKRRRSGFTQVPNYLLSSDELSGLAKALWCLLFSKPDNWVFYWSEILSNFKEGRDSVIKAKKELEKFKYITCKQTKRSMNGRMVFGGMEIELDDQPNLTTLENSDSVPSTEFQGTENQDTEITSTENEQSEVPPTENKDTYKDLDQEDLSNQYLPNKNLSLSQIKELKKLADKILGERDFSIDFKKFIDWCGDEEKLKSSPKNILKSWIEKPENQIKQPSAKNAPTGKKEEPEEIKKLRGDIRFLLHGDAAMQLFFSSVPIEKTKSGYKIIVGDKRALKYEEVLKKIKVEIEKV